jgi:hypothetical protein
MALNAASNQLATLCCLVKSPWQLRAPQPRQLDRGGDLMFPPYLGVF